MTSNRPGAAPAAQAADAGERYLAALDEADRHARTAKLLTLAPPRSHQAFRRWYVGRIAEQLRATRGLTQPPVASPFPQVLADEVDRLSGLEDSTARLELLQKVTGELTGADSVQDIARTVADNAVLFSGVETVRVFVVTREQTCGRWPGGQGSRLLAQVYDEIPLDSDLPGAAVARTRTPLFLRTLAQIYAAFPELTGLLPHRAQPAHRAAARRRPRPGPAGDHLRRRPADRGHRDRIHAVARRRPRPGARARARAVGGHEANARMAFLADASVALSAVSTSTPPSRPSPA